MFQLPGKPSLWANFVGRLIFALIWIGASSGFSYFVWRHRFSTPTFIVVLVGLLDLIAVVLVWDIAARFLRTLRRHQPVVEIDRQSLAYGESAQLRVVEPDPKAIAEMKVKLVGECLITSAMDISHFRQTVCSVTRCYEEELLHLAPPPDEPVSRMLLIQLPKSAPADGVSWKIIIDLRLSEGGIVEHYFPLPVRA